MSTPKIKEVVVMEPGQPAVLYRDQIPLSTLYTLLTQVYPNGKLVAVNDGIWRVISCNPKKATISLELLAIRADMEPPNSQEQPKESYDGNINTESVSGQGTQPGSGTHAQAGDPTVGEGSGSRSEDRSVSGDTEVDRGEPRA